MTKILVFLGVSGSGKSYNARKLSESYKDGKVFDRIVQFTTRPMRDDELEGYDYNFINDKQYQELLDENLVSCKTEINGYKYGTNIKDLINEDGMIKVVVLNVQGCNDILDLKNKHYPEMKIKFVNIISPKKVRREGRDEDHLNQEAEDIRNLHSELTIYDIYNFNPETESYLTLDELVDELKDKLGDFIE